MSTEIQSLLVYVGITNYKYLVIYIYIILFVLRQIYQLVAIRKKRFSENKLACAPKWYVYSEHNSKCYWNFWEIFMGFKNTSIPHLSYSLQNFDFLHIFIWARCENSGYFLSQNTKIAWNIVLNHASVLKQTSCLRRRNWRMLKQISQLLFIFASCCTGQL